MRRLTWRNRAGLVPVVALTMILGAGCVGTSTAKPCSTLPACKATGTRLFGQAVLIPQSAKFLQGAVNKGVLGIEFEDPPTTWTFSMFVGHPGSNKASCPGTIIQIASSRSICYGSTKTALVAQFFAQNLLYTVTVAVPPPSARATQTEQDLVTRIVSDMT